MKCDLCFHHCDLQEGQTGLCFARENKAGQIVSKNYGQITSLALDPIEKKPLYHFYPGSYILSVGSYGCNLKCPFCQNYEISYDNGSSVRGHMSPEELVEYAVKLVRQGNIGIAFTYNEPLIAYEYIKDTFMKAKETGLKTVLVTNGTITTKYLDDLLDYTDAFNIDLKGFSQDIYDRLNGNLELVKTNIIHAHQKAHVEITSLIVPTFNDALEDMEKEASWLADIDNDIPLHITRFFPRYHLQDQAPTSISLLKQMQKIALKHLHHVHLGNV